MAHIQVEASVRTHRKFLQAGPAASWLWLCSVGYAQDGLTDGFIPREALAYLGVQKPDAMADRLVTVGLWDVVPGGWKIHHYERHNRTSSEIQAIKARRAHGGRLSGHLGGRPLKEPSTKPLKVTLEGFSPRNPSGNPQGLSTGNPSGNPISDTDTSHLISDTDTSQTRAPDDRETVPFDVWFRQLAAAYPKQAVTMGHLSESAFVQALRGHPEGPADAWALMQGNLRNQQAGYQWRVKGMIPRMERWLREGLWMQQHEAVPVSAVVSDRTARTLSAASEFIRQGGDA